MRLPILLFLFFEVSYSHPSPQDGQKISLPPGMMQQIMRQIMPNTYPAEGTQTDEPCDNNQPPPNYQPPRYPSDTPFQRKYADQEDVQRVQNMQQTMNPQHIQKRMAGGYDSPQQYFKPPPGQEMGQQNIPANWQGQQQVMERGQILQQQGQQMMQQGEEAMQQRRQEMTQYHQQMQRNYFEARKQLERQQLQLQQQQGDEQSSIQSPQYLRPDVGDAPAYNQMRRFQVPQVQQMTQNFQNDEGDDGYQQPRFQPDAPHYQYGPVCQRPVPPGPPPASEEPPRPVYFGRPAPGAPAGQGEAAPEQRRVYRRMDTSRIQVVRQEGQQAQ